MTPERTKALVEDAIRVTGGKQSDLSRALGCAQQTVSKLLSGEIAMTADWAARIAVATDGQVPFGAFYPELVGERLPEQVAS